jgi:hypothetical protein
MFGSLRRHLSYANIAATMALVFAMGGTAIAAKHYLINSTKQINPKVLKALTVHGKTGPVGPQGAAGQTGATGLAGTQGATGLTGPRGPSDGYTTAATGKTALSFAAGTTVAHLKLPAGSYLLHGEAEVGHQVFKDEANIACFLSAGGASEKVDQFFAANTANEMTLPLQLAVKLSSEGEAVLSCEVLGATGGDTFFASKADLDAVQVGSLHTQ